MANEGLLCRIYIHLTASPTIIYFRLNPYKTLEHIHSMNSHS
jgi:hypothetical protein